MESKQYLENVRRYELKIERMIAERERCRNIAQSVSGGGADDAVSRSRKLDKSEDGVIRLMERADELQTEICVCIDYRSEAFYYLNVMRNEAGKQVLYKRYFENKRWEDVADEMGYTFRHCTRIHNIALREYQRAMSTCPRMSHI